MLSIELSEDVNNQLELLSLSTGRTKEYYLLEAIKYYLEDAEERIHVMDENSNCYFSFVDANGFDGEYGLEPD
ncbi:MAG: hypothetical protein AB8B95_01810 [Pseudohongiellaceae bacterium]